MSERDPGTKCVERRAGPGTLTSCHSVIQSHPWLWHRKVTTDAQTDQHQGGPALILENWVLFLLLLCPLSLNEVTCFNVTLCSLTSEKPPLQWYVELHTKTDYTNLSIWENSREKSGESSGRQALGTRGDCCPWSGLPDKGQLFWVVFIINIHLLPI